MDLPMILDEETSIPIYRQIKFQLSYLITSRRLPEGAQLPPVREAAQTWGVSPGTVALAYRELQADGLIASDRRRGTYVREFIPDEADDPQRDAQLNTVLENALLKAFSLGYGKDEVQHRIGTLLSVMSTTPLPVVFVAPTPDISKKYATLLERHLHGEVQVRPVVFDDVMKADGATRALFSRVYFVVTFARSVSQLEKVLSEWDSTWRVLGISTEVTPTTLATLAKVDPNQRICLISQERYIHVSLNLIQEGNPKLQLDSVLMEPPARLVRQAAREADLVLYTFGVKDVVTNNVPESKRLELEFDVNDDSIEKLRRIFGATRTHRSGIVRSGA